MTTNSKVALAAAGAVSLVLALVADRHAQNHYIPGSRPTR
jgi:hypothetical protein